MESSLQNRTSRREATGPLAGTVVQLSIHFFPGRNLAFECTRMSRGCRTIIGIKVVIKNASSLLTVTAIHLIYCTGKKNLHRLRHKMLMLSALERGRAMHRVQKLQRWYMFISRPFVAVIALKSGFQRHSCSLSTSSLSSPPNALVVDDLRRTPVHHTHQ